MHFLWLILLLLMSVSTARAQILDLTVQEGIGVEQLLKAYRRAEDPEERERIALLLAMREETPLTQLIELRRTENAPRAQDVLNVALAMRGQESAQKLVLDALAASWNEEMKRWLGFVEFIGQDWALMGLSPILDNMIPLEYLGRDGLGDHGPEYLRACDLAVNIIARARSRGFPFAVDGQTQYNEEERAQVRAFLQGFRPKIEVFDHTDP